MDTETREKQSSRTWVENTRYYLSDHALCVALEDKTLCSFDGSASDSTRMLLVYLLLSYEHGDIVFTCHKDRCVNGPTGRISFVCHNALFSTQRLSIKYTYILIPKMPCQNIGRTNTLNISQQPSSDECR